MPANHNVPHTAEAKAKMSAARKGKPALWKHRPSKDVDGALHYRCSDCKKFLPKEGFHADKRTVLGIKTQCKVCHNACNVRSRDKGNKRLKQEAAREIERLTAELANARAADIHSCHDQCTRAQSGRMHPR